MTIPRRMRAAVLYGPEDVRMEEIPVPEIGPGDVLLRIRAALTCGTDAKVFLRGGHPTMIRPPAPFGHEFSGVVAAVGSEVEGFEEGMRAVSANSAPCGECRYCGLGRESLCDDILYINGAYAEYIAIPERIVKKNLLPIPDHLSFQHAALLEPLACVVHGVEESKIRPGDTVVVNGAGPIGLFFVGLARLKGAAVISTDTVAERLDVARRVGASETIIASQSEDTVEAVRALTAGGEGADVAVDATGVPAVWEAATKMVRKGGLVNLFGGCKPGTTFTLDTHLIHYSETTITGVYHHTPGHVREALNLLASGKIKSEEFVTRELPLDRVHEALRLIIDREGVKTAVIP